MFPLAIGPKMAFLRSCLANWLEQQDFLDFFPLYCIQHCFICRPSDSKTKVDLIHWLAGTSQEPVFNSQAVEWTDCDVTAEQVYNTLEWDREKAWVY